MKLVANYVEKPWGRHDLPAWAKPPATMDGAIGELWFTPPDGRALPLLVKYIFTSERLSIQVHPDDVQARARGLAGGKTECWYIIAAEPGATLGVGLEADLDARQLTEAALDGSIVEKMVWHPVVPGDFFFIPAGTIHAIGAGVTLVEIQQNVDVTYRLYDYGRPRELHLDDGTAVSRAGPYDPVQAVRAADGGPLDRMMADCPIFHVFRSADAGAIRDRLGHGPIWIVPISGAIGANAETAGVGECLYLEGDGIAALTLSEDAVVLAAGQGMC
ncbi:class I mannose-6-phosphate isomerase [Sphingomonas sp.]|uniref:class I mannose-6-phosphate isomerase n=1 Tax=Sphingomonas sp. TaxID=28214 RepID=UPI000DB43BD8|nr:class I mannose-6-phosphate isomerase [Sphingomonas sp.]PZU11084.1 MAG: phosphoheptose isomerase [Sphingomonas sp.]